MHSVKGECTYKLDGKFQVRYFSIKHIGKCTYAQIVIVVEQLNKTTNNRPDLNNQDTSIPLKFSLWLHGYTVLDKVLTNPHILACIAISNGK